MKWFDNWFQRQCKKAWYSAQGSDPIEETIKNWQPAPGLQPNLNRDGIRFQIHRAVGGYVVEYYDHTKNTTVGMDYTNQLQIIPEDADLGQELSKIIMMETLKS